jgi:hypothetical protein
MVLTYARKWAAYAACCQQKVQLSTLLLQNQAGRTDQLGQQLIMRAHSMLQACVVSDLIIGVTRNGVTCIADAALLDATSRNISDPAVKLRLPQWAL